MLLVRDKYSACFGFLFAAAFAAIGGNQLTLFDIELIRRHYLPFMKAFATQRTLALVALLFGFFEGNDVGHGGKFTGESVWP